jgi:hypothetical protein
MRHGFGMVGMLQLWWVVILVARFVPDGFARWKAAGAAGGGLAGDTGSGAR